VAREHLYFCNAAGTEARAQYTREGMVVLEGSKARAVVSDSFRSKAFYAQRLKLQEAGILKLAGDHLHFTQDYVFKSPSSAAASVVGNNMNGWVTWKNAAGETLDQVVRQG